ncbi:SPFH domain-containing protein [Kribbella solani]|uniref:Regulator of protease activity HflC (Stomatin/prohibitin superfamily) n=1 Tax=Kribbella solani TaxID=236067 RepID=A0A841DNT1_9ACTN|nr:SPFH domain-containing protein [Kribbella solani]MBB5978340.1 regulator of protease activity HflC (stomatin/prohibitin superfamily) [Kribbella solani]
MQHATVDLWAGEPAAAYPLVVLAVLAVVAAVEPRIVPRDRWLVVLRSGLVRRVLATGVSVRIPLLESYVWIARGRTRRPLTVTARTGDGTEVRVAAETIIEVVDPLAAIQLSLTPVDLALDETERALRQLIARHDVVSLAALRTCTVPVDVPGVVIGELELGKVELELTPQAIRSVADQTK